MSNLVFLGVGALLFIVAVGLLAFRPKFFAIPWLGMSIIVLGTGVTFNVSAHLVSGGHDGVGIGPVITSMFGLVGLGIVSSSVRLRAVAFVPLGAVVAGGIYISSFYAYLPPFNADFPGQFVFAAPGIVLVAYGAFLWYRNGLAESMEQRSLLRRLGIALAIVAGVGVLILLQDKPPGSGDPLLAHPPNLLLIAEKSPLVVEGVAVDRKQFKYKAKQTGRTIRYTLYEMDIVHFWRGTGPQTIHFAVRDYSPVEMRVGQPYLIFTERMANDEELPGHWSVDFPTHVWIPSDNKFYPYPGLPREEPMTRDFLANLLESQTYIGN